MNRNKHYLRPLEHSFKVRSRLYCEGNIEPIAALPVNTPARRSDSFNFQSCRPKVIAGKTGLLDLFPKFHDTKINRGV